MVVRAAAVGGHEADTKIELVDVKDNKITEANSNKTYFSTRIISIDVQDERLPVKHEVEQGVGGRSVN